MRKRCFVEHTSYEPPAKKSPIVSGSPTADVKSGMFLTDITGKKWRLGKTIGTGGFGEIFLASDCITQEVKTDAQYVAKVESHTSGPLFVEIHCYLNIAKLQMIKDWKDKTGVKHLGIPHYVAFGSHVISGIKYRFLIIPRFESDLEKMYEIKRHKFNLKTVLTISLQIIDVLQYIHSKGYLHLDIKASNMGFNLNKKPTVAPVTQVESRTVRYHSCLPVRTCREKKFIVPRVLRPNSRLRTLRLDVKHDTKETNINFNDSADRVYLLDYGLACKYLWTDGSHKEFSKDQRKAHAGTILFCSRDAHIGAQSRRSDLECLGYNLIYWLTSNLPWSENTDNPDIVYKKKLRCIENLKEFINFSFDYDSPSFVYEYFNYLLNLEFDEEPDYDHCKNIFKGALQEYGYKDDLHLDFNNTEGWNRKQKKVKCNLENFKMQCAIQKFKRTPLNSNPPIRPILRKEIINKKLKRKLNWSKILMDPEIIIRQKGKSRSKERKITESSDSNGTPLGIMNLDINQLNPNAAMLDIFNRFLDRLSSGGSSPHSRGDSALDTIEGYTPAMMEVYNRKREREEMEAEFDMLETIKLSKRVTYKTKRKNSSGSLSKLTKQRKGRTTKAEVPSNKKEKKLLKPASLRKTYSLRG